MSTLSVSFDPITYLSNLDNEHKRTILMRLLADTLLDITKLNIMILI